MRRASAKRRERIAGGLAAGRVPADFDPVALRRGTQVELEHTDDWDTAEEIAMDHLAEDPDYYDKLALMESGRCKPNRAPRVRVYDAYNVAKQMRETFTDRPVERTEKFPFDWPTVMQNVGDSLAVAYASDKWQPKGRDGRRDIELYKHLAESRNRALVVPGVMYDNDDPSESWPVRGPMVSLSECPMPKHFAILGLFEEIDLHLYTAGSSKRPRFAKNPDDGVVHVRVRHAHLGGSKILWSQIDPRRDDEPFIFVYTKGDGVMFLVIGDELDIEKDGIVG